VPRGIFGTRRARYRKPLAAIAIKDQPEGADREAGRIIPSRGELMSVSGISSSNLFDSINQTTQNNMQQFQKEFQQLGQDLQSGNLSAAQSDFVTLQQLGPQSSSTAAAQSSSPIAQAFNQLAQDLQSGNISGAQQDFANIQQAFQNQASQSRGHHHHHHGGGDSGGSAISQLFDQLGQALQSGNLSSAQQAYNSLVQDFQQLGQGAGQASAQPSSSSSSTGVSVSA
jgi:outer membrane protein assembly factor BamD (BamD/ComL family)